MGRPSGQGRMRRIGAGLVAGVLVWLTSVAVIGVGPATACSCAGGTVEDFRDWADLGFIGELLEQGTADDAIDDQFGSNVPHRFSVERSIFGEIDSAEVTVYSPAGGGSCGFELRIGERAAIFAQDKGDRFSGGLCSTMPAEVALAEIEPAEAESGLARLAVIGNLGGSLIAYFDDAGQFLGYEGSIKSDSGWQPWSVRCEDGQHAAILEGAMIRVVSLTTAEDAIEPIAVAEDFGPQIARCQEPNSLVIAEQPNSGGWQERDLATGATSSITDSPSGQAVATNHGFAVVEYLDPGERLMMVGDDGGREYGRLDRTAEESHRGYASVEASPDGNALSVLEVSYRGHGVATSVLRVLDAATGDELVSRSFEQESWGAHWVDGDHMTITFGVDEVSHVEVLKATTLASVDRFNGWRPHRSTLLDGVLWGVEDGTLYRAETGGEAKPVFTFPARILADVLILPEPIERLAPGTAASESSGSTTSSSPGTTSTTAASPLDETASEAAQTPDTPKGGGLDATLIGGSTVGAGAAIVGVLLFRQRRHSA